MEAPYLKIVMSSVFWDINPCGRLKSTEVSEKNVAGQTTRRYIPEDRTLHNHRCESLKFDIIGNACDTVLPGQVSVIQENGAMAE
jgi:hypothetical protein